MPPPVPAAPVATVLSVTGPAAQRYQPGSLLRLGEVVTVGDGEIMLSYLSGCRRETVQGGQFVAGAERSGGATGRVVADTVPCAPGKPVLTADGRAAAPASTVVRTPRPIFQWGVGPATVKLYDLSGDEPVMIWQARATSPQAAYPSDAPRLRPGVAYTVRADMGERQLSADFTLDPSLELPHDQASVVVLR